MIFDWRTEYYRYRKYFFADISRFSKNKKTRVYTEIVFYFLTTSFFLFAAIRPTAITISELVRKIKDQKLVAQKLQEKINALTLAQERFGIIQENLYLLDQALPKDPQISSLIKQIELLGTKSNVVLKGINYSSVPLRDEFTEKRREIDFKITAIGDYQNLKSFLFNLGRLRRIVIIDSFGFKIGKDKNENRNLILTITARAFFWREKNEGV